MEKPKKRKKVSIVRFLDRYGTQIGAITGTVVGYELAQKYQKDTFYYTILGGFIGTILGNALTDSID
jgi:uncharacterized protein YcfJ